MKRWVLFAGFGLAAGALLLVIAALAVALLLASTPEGAGAPSVAGATGVDVCSENPAYAEALVALGWLADHPPQEANAGAYGHAQLDALYQQLVDQGDVTPPPPGCTLTAREDTPLLVRPHPDADVSGTLAAGQTVTVYGRSADMSWWYVNASPVWGWIRAEAGELQAGAEVTLIPNFE
jgi:hypothetical protein